jgi:hypothetical protein
LVGSVLRPSWLAAVVALSLVGWSTYLVLQPRAHPGSDLSRGWYSDHYSHLSACRALIWGRVNIWRDPLAAVLPKPSPEERQLAPAVVRESPEVYLLPGSSPAKPIVASWSRLPRPYPPGDCVAVLPAGLLYEFFDVSFPTITRVLVWLFLLYAHLGILLSWQVAIRATPQRVVAGVLLYFESIHWALEGFYDGAAVAPLLASLMFFAQKRWLAALFAYCMAAFFHFRAYFFGPLALVATFNLLRSQSWKQWRARHWLALIAAAVFGVLSLSTFALTYGSLASFPLDNPVAWTSQWQTRVGILVMAAAIAGVFVYSRAWVDLLLSGWILLMVTNLRQAFAWHALLLLPWLFVPNQSTDAQRAAIADGARLVLVLFLSLVVFRNPLVPSWLAQLP